MLVLFVVVVMMLWVVGWREMEQLRLGTEVNHWSRILPDSGPVRKGSLLVREILD